MSLLLSWNNDTAAHVLSDGLSLAPDGRVISTTRRKFFETRGGAIIGACGFTHLRREMQFRFSSSLAPFDELLNQVEEFVKEANGTHRPTAQSRPIGAVVVGIESGRVRSANVSKDGVVRSVCGWPAVHWLTAAQEDDVLMRQVAQSIWGTALEDVPKEMRRGARLLFQELGEKMGGEIYEACLSARGD